MADDNQEIDLFTEFENGCTENGHIWWDARWLMEQLGYKSWTSFQGVLNDAIGSCMRLGVNVNETFQQHSVLSEGKQSLSYKLNRFAVFLVVQHADAKKPRVSELRGYLAAFAAVAATAIEDDGALLRIELRSKLKDGESHMSGAAVAAGVRSGEMGIFKDAGYRGMYNMGARDLKKLKGLKSKDVAYDFMGVVELAAHNYRVTQTAERIRTRKLKGLQATSEAAKEVGAKVRRDMIENTGVAPEHLQIDDNIKQIESGFKKTNKNMIAHDKKNKKGDS